MSTTKEKLDAIEHSIKVTKKRAEILRAIKECSTLHKTQQYELDMCEKLIQYGEKMLRESGRLK